MARKSEAGRPKGSKKAFKLPVGPKKVGALLANLKRREGWMTEGLTPRKAVGMAVNSVQYALGSSRMLAWPTVVKIDVSPLCNLACPHCVHGRPGNDNGLKGQYFNKRQMMTVEQYRGIIDEVAGKSTAVSLYYLGDPLMHPDHDELCRIARDAGLNVHTSTNFSFKLSDERIEQIARSGLTHMSV